MKNRTPPNFTIGNFGRPVSKSAHSKVILPLMGIQVAFEVVLYGVLGAFNRLVEPTDTVQACCWCVQWLLMLGD